MKKNTLFLDFPEGFPFRTAQAKLTYMVLHLKATKKVEKQKHIINSHLFLLTSQNRRKMLIKEEAFSLLPAFSVERTEFCFCENNTDLTWLNHIKRAKSATVAVAGTESAANLV